MALISLVIFAVVIVLAFVLKKNTGILAIFAALLLARINGISDKELLGMFDSKMFLMLFGVMYLFSIAQENGTLELLAKKILRLCGGRSKLFPPLLFVLSAVLSAIGPGLISVTALMAALVVALAKQVGVHPIRLLPFATLGAFAGGLSPISPSGIVAMETAANAGIEGLLLPLNLHMALTCLLFAVALFFVFKCYQFQNVTITGEKPAPFTWQQWMTLGGILVTALVTVLLSVNVGLVGISVSLLLTIVGCGNEGAALKRVPLGTLIMVTGAGMLISVVTKLGGIDLLQSCIGKLMHGKTANGVLTFIIGIIAWFVSTSGVIMPTFIPIAAELAAGVPFTAVSLTVGLCASAHLAALSPLSTCGGLMLAAYAGSEGVTKKDGDKMFMQLFLLSAAGVAFSAILALVGLYN